MEQSGESSDVLRSVAAYLLGAVVASTQKMREVVEQLVKDGDLTRQQGEKLLGEIRALAIGAPYGNRRGRDVRADVLDARALRFQRVYLLGVNERAFPTLAQDRCFINESDRAAWAGRGVLLDLDYRYIRRLIEARKVPDQPMPADSELSLFVLPVYTTQCYM